MVTVSTEVSAQTEARLRGVFRRSSVDWLPRLWAFVEREDASSRDDWIAEIRDDGHLSALCPATGTAAERFGVFRVVLPRDEDDSGFVGWLASRVKAATGSGMFVICGHDQERGGVFDYYGVPETAVADVRALLHRFTTSESLDGVVMRVVESADNTGIGPDTVVCFDQNGTTITARYGGGSVLDGWLAGTLEPSTPEPITAQPSTSHARFQYLQIGVDGSIDNGQSIAEVRRLPDGRWQLTEHFTWASRHGAGINRLEEIPPPAVT